MIRRLVGGLGRMDTAEIAWRGTTAARTMVDRTRARFVAPRWKREHLLPALAPLDELTAVRAALAGRRWTDAQRQLARHFARAPQRFVIGPGSRAALVDRIRNAFPDAVREAAARADRILAGEYDLLGYQGLRFDATSPALPDLPDPPDPRDPHRLPDWHLDPIHQRRAPQAFWSTVSYLDPQYGDHKIIWELNRHQHWIALGRAFWLTGDRKYRDRCLAELAGWLEANPPLVGVNWASMLELAFRSLSWMWAINFFAADDGPAACPEVRRGEAGHYGVGAPWLVDLLAALDRQLTHVERNLSQYFSPNTHLLGEALALYVSGRALPELAASARRQATGRRILLAEIERQIAADGGHCERSTHYHRYTLDFYSLALAVARITADEAARPFARAVERLAVAARLLADDRGRIPHIGDDDGGALMPMTGRAPDDLRDSLAIAATLVGRPDFQIGDVPEEALWILGPQSAVRNPESAICNQPSAISPVISAALPDTGYYISRSRAGDHLVIDGGLHGYQNGGHAHADALSLTFTVRGLPLLIDPGTACYTTDLGLRDRMRSTALHNTLTLDDRPQSVPSGPFHWSHVANTRVDAWRAGDGFDYFDGSHDGYHPVVHRRRVLVLHGDLVVVADLIDGPGAHAAAVHWHLDPGWTVEARAHGAIFTRGEGNARVGLVVPQGLVEPFAADAETGLGWYSPAYGRLDRTTTIRVSQSGTAPFWMVSVFDLDPENTVADVNWVPVWAEAGAIAHGAAIRITRATSIDHVLWVEPVDQDITAEHAPHAEHNVFAAGSASSAVERQARWRVGEFETDARMLFCRATDDGSLDRCAMVDGSILRVAGRRAIELALGDIERDFCWTRDQGRTKDQAPRTKDPCAASPVS